MTIEYIEGFHALDLPAKSWEGKWSVCGDDNNMLYLLNGDRRELCDLDVIEFNDIQPNLYFDSEWIAHQQASIYYSLHCESYPYMKEWNKCDQGQVDPTVVTELKSQIMVFE